MGLWRSKRRYEENRRFSERASSALLAIGILENSEEGLNTSFSDDELREYLTTGVELLDDIKTGLEEPTTVDDYTLALAQHLSHNRKVPREDLADELDRHIEILQDARETLEPPSRINRAVQTIEEIEEIAGRVTEQEAAELRDTLVG